MAKMSGSRVVCKCCGHHELIDAVHLEPVEIVQHVRRLHARGPDHELRRDDLAAREPHAIGAHLGHARLRAHLDAELAQDLQRRGRNAFGQGRQNALGGLDEDDANVLVGIDMIEAEGGDLAGRLIQFRRELGTRRASADDGDM